jgi:hypothetical protein
MRIRYMSMIELMIAMLLFSMFSASLFAFTRWISMVHLHNQEQYEQVSHEKMFINRLDYIFNHLVISADLESDDALYGSEFELRCFYKPEFTFSPFVSGVMSARLFIEGDVLIMESTSENHEQIFYDHLLDGVTQCKIHYLTTDQEKDEMIISNEWVGHESKWPIFVRIEIDFVDGRQHCHLFRLMDGGISPIQLRS